MNEMELTEGQLLSRDFGVSAPQENKPVRPLEVIEAELDVLERDTRQKEITLIENYIEVGRRLAEVKAQLPHGSWGPWLENRGYQQAKAEKLMRLFDAYGKEQLSLFGSEAKSQAFANLSFHKLVKLIAIEDEGERERFVIENDVEHMSTRELQRALKARDEAEEAAAAAKEEARKLNGEVDRLNAKLIDQARDYDARLISVGVDADQARAAAKAAQEALEKQRDKAQRLQTALSEANTAAQAAEDEHSRLLRELEELRGWPAEADTEAIEAARKAAIAEMTEKVDKAKDAKKKADEKRKTVEKALEAAQRELAELKAKGPEVRELTQEEKDALTAQAVAQARAKDIERIQALEKQLVKADPNVAEFEVHFNAWQAEYRRMAEVLARTDGDRADRLRQAVKAALEQMDAL